MGLGLEGLVRLDAVAVGYDRRAAVAMGDRHHALYLMPHLPRWITTARSGSGFVELAEALIAARS